MQVFRHFLSLFLSLTRVSRFGQNFAARAPGGNAAADTSRPRVKSQRFCPTQTESRHNAESPSGTAETVIIFSDEKFRRAQVSRDRWGYDTDSGSTQSSDEGRERA